MLIVRVGERSLGVLLGCSRPRAKLSFPLSLSSSLRNPWFSILTTFYHRPMQSSVLCPRSWWNSHRAFDFRVVGSDFIFAGRCTLFPSLSSAYNTSEGETQNLCVDNKGGIPHSFRWGRRVAVVRLRTLVAADEMIGRMFDVFPYWDAGFVPCPSLCRSLLISGSIVVSLLLGPLRSSSSARTSAQ